METDIEADKSGDIKRHIHRNREQRATQTSHVTQAYTITQNSIQRNADTKTPGCRQIHPYIQNGTDTKTQVDYD